MNGLRIWVIVLFLLPSLTPMGAYERRVHELMTRHAFNRLAVDFERRLGIARGYEVNDRSLSEHMEKAAMDEDDVPNSLNHFLDPEHDAPLTTRLPFGVCLPNGIPADRWARENSFGTHTLYWLPLMYKHAVLGPNQGTRDVYLVELFKTFGHVIHLVQDMAQPEHTRNDQHLTFSNILLSNGASPSVWETWGQANLVERLDPVTGAAIDPAVSYDGYPTVVLPDYGSYFQTPEYPTLERTGLANFSNRNFVTQDTNYSGQGDCGQNSFRCFDYAYPSIDDPLTTYRVEPVYESVIDDAGHSVVKLVDEQIYTSQVYDAYAGTLEADPFHTFHSLLDMETRRYGCPVYSLGDGSYLSRASMLVPRAVGYSAGLIEHFFRGKIDVKWASTGNGEYDMTIANLSSEAIGSDASVAAVYRTEPAYFGAGSNDTGAIVNGALADLVPGFGGLASGQSVTVHAVKPFGLHAGDLVTKFERRVVITGTLGSTPNEAIGLIQSPGTSTGLRAEITWSAAPLADGSIPYPRQIHMTDGTDYAHWFGLSYGYERCSDIVAGQNVCIVSPPPPYQPVEFKMNPMVAGKTFQFQIASFHRRYTFTVTTKFYLDDQLVKTQTSVVRESPTGGVTFARYP